MIRQPPAFFRPGPAGFPGWRWRKISQCWTLHRAIHKFVFVIRGRARLDSQLGFTEHDYDEYGWLVTTIFQECFNSERSWDSTLGGWIARAKFYRNRSRYSGM